MSGIPAATVTAWNAAQARLALAPGRAAELTIELDQLAAAIAAVQPALVFEAEPGDFRTALLAVAAR